MRAGPRVGLTGSLGTGKSTVLKIFVRAGWKALDADALARRAVRPGRPAYGAIVRGFGPGVVKPGGTLDRAKLAVIVFASAAKRRKLNKIIHPPVRRAIGRFLKGKSARVVSVPLLYETGMQKMFDRIVVVRAFKKDVQRRLRRERGMSKAQIRARMAAQMPLNTKCRKADFVLDNTGSLKGLQRQVRELIRQWNRK